MMVKLFYKLNIESFYKLKIIYQLMNPDFKNLPNKALFSNDPELNKL